MIPIQPATRRLIPCMSNQATATVVGLSWLTMIAMQRIRDHDYLRPVSTFAASIITNQVFNFHPLTPARLRERNPLELAAIISLMYLPLLLAMFKVSDTTDLFADFTGVAYANTLLWNAAEL